jgi:hypothetical protein
MWKEENYLKKNFYLSILKFGLAAGINQAICKFILTFTESLVDLLIVLGAVHSLCYA